MNIKITAKEKVYLVIALILVAFFIVFIVQNSNEIPIQFIFGKTITALSLALVISFFIGLISGAIGTIVYLKQKKKTE